VRRVDETVARGRYRDKDCPARHIGLIAPRSTVLLSASYGETKEALGGYYLIDVPNLDDAIEAAAECPGASYGTIELRPVMELPERTEV